MKKVLKIKILSPLFCYKMTVLFLGLSLANFFLYPNEASAQFERSKFRSKTDFKNKSKDKTANKVVAPPGSSNSNAANNRDQFGRSESQNNPDVTLSVSQNPNISQDEKEKLEQESSKYVNLNTETAFGPEVITSFDFPKVDLTDLTKHMQKLTGINIIIDKPIKGKISIMAPSPITVGDAWKAYLSALNVNGYSLVKSGSFYRIVPTRDIRYTPTKIYTGSFTPETENYAMRVIPLKNIEASELTRSFRPFMSRYGRLIDLKQTNTLLIQDTGSNINRLVRLIKFVDVPGHEESLQIFPIKHSSASEIAKLLDQILKSKTSRSSSGSSSRRRRSSRSSSNATKLIAEPRTNSIIAMANADEAKNIRELIKKLDTKVASRGSGQVHVYYLNHGDAENLSKTLSELVGSSRQNNSRRRRTSRFTRNEDQGNELFSSQVKVTADVDNNALVVTASPTDYLTLKEVIAKLDIPRDQVYVEGLIMENSVNRDREFGISIIGNYGAGSGEVVGSLQGKSGTDLVSLVTGQFNNLSGLFAPFGGGRTRQLQVEEQTFNVSSVAGLIKAIATTTDANVLATPQILAMDNEEAVFTVGEEIPTTVTTNANNTTQTGLQPQRATLELSIKPNINRVTRFIKMDIKFQADDFSERILPAGVTNGSAVNLRSAKTSVTVRDRDTVAMGGLMRDSENVTESKVPLLGDIPVLGWLFKSQEKTVNKRNLLMFLTPKILATYEETAASTLKDVLNRRGAHLKDTLGEDDPFKTTVKGLYEKAKAQEQGPLFDQKNRYKEENENTEGLDSLEGKDFGQVPNYQLIQQEVRTKKAAPTRLKKRKKKKGQKYQENKK